MTLGDRGHISQIRKLGHSVIAEVAVVTQTQWGLEQSSWVLSLCTVIPVTYDTLFLHARADTVLDKKANIQNDMAKKCYCVIAYKMRRVTLEGWLLKWTSGKKNSSARKAFL